MSTPKRGRGRPRIVDPEPAVNVNFRLPADLLALVDTYSARLQSQGLRGGRSDALRALVVAGLAAEKIGENRE